MKIVRVVAGLALAMMSFYTWSAAAPVDGVSRCRRGACGIRGAAGGIRRGRRRDRGRARARGRHAYATRPPGLPLPLCA